VLDLPVEVVAVEGGAIKAGEAEAGATLGRHLRDAVAVAAGGEAAHLAARAASTTARTPQPTTPLTPLARVGGGVTGSTLRQGVRHAVRQ
jgi:hypothetical protein